jgi:hypothetical protein
VDEKSQSLMEEIHSINLAFQHKPFNEESQAHRQFKLKYLAKAKDLQEQFPWLNFSKEIDYFSL